MWLRVVMPVSLAILAPGVGFIASQTIYNGKEIAVLQRTYMTLEQAVHLINEHERIGPHRQAMTRTEVAKEIERAMAQMEARQEIRDKNMQSRLDRIEEALRSK